MQIDPKLRLSATDLLFKLQFLSPLVLTSNLIRNNNDDLILDTLLIKKDI